MPEEWFEVATVNYRLILHGRKAGGERVEIDLTQDERDRIEAFMDAQSDLEQHLYRSILEQHP